MKILFSGLIISMFSINLYASGFTPECQKAFEKLCPPKSSDADAKCMEKNIEKLPPECKKALKGNGPNPCSEDALKFGDKCKDKKGDELKKCVSDIAEKIQLQMQSKGSKDCQKYIKPKVEECPLPPSPIYKNRADQANEDYDKYFDKLSPGCKEKAKLQNP